MLRQALAALLLATSAIAVYHRVLEHEFVHYDDFAYIVDNPRLHSEVPPGELLQNLAAPALANWNPLTNASLVVDHALHGLSAPGVHATNLALHVASSVILLLALSLLTRAFWPSAFVAGVFAVHPLHVESVAWASERKDVLSGLFWMLTLWAYAWQQRRRQALWSALLVALCLGLGLLAKPMLVTLPFVLLLLDLWPLERLYTSGGSAGLLSFAKLRSCALEKLPLFGLVGLISAITFVVQDQAGAVQALDRLPLGTRLGNAAEAYLAYLVASFWPQDLAVFYPRADALSPATMVGSAVLLIAMSWVTLRTLPTRPYLAVGWFWFLGTLVPVIGLVQVGLQARADRYMYLPQIGLTIMLAWGVRDLLHASGSARWRRLAVGGMGVACLAALATVAFHQVGYWRDSEALFGRATRVTQDNYFAHSGLADALLRQDRLDEAVEHYKAASLAKPSWAKPYVGLADVRVKQGRVEEAIPIFERALVLDPNQPRAHTSMGLALLRLARYEDAATHLERALALFEAAGLLPGRGGPPHFGLAAVARRNGDLELAAQHYEQGLQLAPGAIRSRLDFARLLIETGRLREASSQLDRIAATGHRSPDLDAARGVVAEQQGRLADAVELYSRALEQRPQWPGTANNLAWILATAADPSLRDPEEAVRLAEVATEVGATGGPGLLDTLAAAYASTGRFDDAVRTARRALELATVDEHHELAEQVRDHLVLYESGRPYRSQ